MYLEEDRKSKETMKVPMHELRMLRQKFESGTEIEWSEHVEELSGLYNLDNHDITDALIRLGLINKNNKQKEMF